MVEESTAYPIPLEESVAQEIARRAAEIPDYQLSVDLEGTHRNAFIPLPPDSQLLNVD